MTQSNSNFPEWSPEDVIAEWREKLDEAKYWHAKFPQVEMDMTEVDLYYRLLTYPDMKTVWERLPKYKIKPSLFSGWVAHSKIYLKGTPNNLTPKEHAQWVNKVKETALTLAGLIELTDYDRLLSEQYYKKRNKYVLKDTMMHAIQVLKPGFVADNLGEPESDRWPNLNPGLLSENLRRMAKMNSEDDVGLLGIKKESIRLERPNHENAARTYFIKNLTKSIRDHTGQPLRDIVTRTTATVFDIPSLSEREVIRAAP